MGRVYKKSMKLEHVCYEIRGPVLEKAKQLEEEGFNIIKLNTGNPPAFGINAPDEIIHDVILNLPHAEAYSDSKGIFPARKAIMQYYELKGIEDIDTEYIYIGNGVSELIVMAMQGLLNNGDEVLIPAPDYPLWTAAVSLSGGKPVHYICDEEQNWMPDIKDIKKKITPNTKGIVIINPNNPTGSVYSKDVLMEIVKLAEENEIILFADEIYDNILYDDAVHIPIATLTKDVLVVTFGGLSKTHRLPGFRVGWMILTGDKESTKDYIEGLNILSSMRLCSNVQGQYAIQTALGGPQDIKKLTAPGGRLYEQRNLAYKIFSSIDGVSCVKPQGALYLFPKIDIKKFNIKDDQKFVYDFLVAKKVLLVQGTGFNWPTPDHFRVVFLPDLEELQEVGQRFKDFLKDYKQE
ncbi:MAG: pyridoxal phosphate-dependent aminotransferase [Brevinematales bacterium]|nr:pyridoxal phosphate-dependent aminotransferase [Brevinematales bacterium]